MLNSQGVFHIALIQYTQGSEMREPVANLIAPMGLQIGVAQLNCPEETCSSPTMRDDGRCGEREREMDFFYLDPFYPSINDVSTQVFLLHCYSWSLLGIVGSSGVSERHKATVHQAKVTYNSLMSLFSDEGRWQRALLCFRDVEFTGWVQFSNGAVTTIQNPLVACKATMSVYWVGKVWRKCLVILAHIYIYIIYAYMYLISVYIYIYMCVYSTYVRIFRDMNWWSSQKRRRSCASCLLDVSRSDETPKF